MQTVNFSASNADESEYIIYSTNIEGDTTHETYIKKIKNIKTGTTYEENGYSSDQGNWTVHFFSDGKTIKKEFPYYEIHPGTIFKSCKLLKTMNMIEDSHHNIPKKFVVKKSLVRIK